jgi:excisionase family DNA binding protein
MHQTDLVPLHEAIRRLGVSRLTLRRRLAEREIPLYRTPLDRRLRLLREADIQSLLLATQAPTRRKVSQ